MPTIRGWLLGVGQYCTIEDIKQYKYDTCSRFYQTWQAGWNLNLQKSTYLRHLINGVEILFLFYIVLFFIFWILGVPSLLLPLSPQLVLVHILAIFLFLSSFSFFFEKKVQDN